MSKIDAFRQAAPPWYARTADPASIPPADLVGGFRADADADWTVAVRNASPDVVALYLLAKAIQARVKAGRNSLLATQRRELDRVLTLLDAP